MQKAALYTSGVFFAVGAIAHVVRLTTGMEIVIGSRGALRRAARPLDGCRGAALVSRPAPRLHKLSG
jgi:hypothetical protein